MNTRLHIVLRSGLALSILLLCGITFYSYFVFEPVKQKIYFDAAQMEPGSPDWGMGVFGYSLAVKISLETERNDRYLHVQIPGGQEYTGIVFALRSSVPNSSRFAVEWRANKDIKGLQLDINDTSLPAEQISSSSQDIEFKELFSNTTGTANPKWSVQKIPLQRFTRNLYQPKESHNDGVLNSDAIYSVGITLPTSFNTTIDIHKIWFEWNQPLGWFLLLLVFMMLLGGVLFYRTDETTSFLYHGPAFFTVQASTRWSFILCSLFIVSEILFNSSSIMNWQNCVLYTLVPLWFLFDELFPRRIGSPLLYDLRYAFPYIVLGFFYCYIHPFSLVLLLFVSFMPAMQSNNRGSIVAILLLYCLALPWNDYPRLNDLFFQYLIVFVVAFLTIWILETIRQYSAHQNLLVNYGSLQKTYSDVIRSIPSGLFIFRLSPSNHLSLVHANPEAERIANKKLTENPTIEFNDLWISVDQQETEQELLEVARSRDVFMKNIQHTDANNHNRYYRIRAFSLPENQLAVLIDDETRNKKMEEELLHWEKLRALEQMAGGLAHNMNNLLTGVIGNLSLAESMAQKEVKTHIQNANNSADKTAKLVLQLLTFCKKEMVILDRIHLPHVVDEAYQMARQVIDDSIGMTIEQETHLPEIQADRNHIQSIVFNLCMNARDAIQQREDFSKEGRRFRIAVSTKAVALDSKEQGDKPIRKSGSYVCLSVSDNGIGIPDYLRARIFEPFFTTKDPTSIGLGLSSTHSIVERYSGWIEVQSELGKGSTFNVYLPMDLSKSSYDEKI